jgi:creatinine amidohydrolase/Fe(II)-dependent formamide hydrolase-like protein
MQTYAIFPPSDDIIPKSGVFSTATFASREKGEKLAKQLVDSIVEIGRLELGW